MTIGIRLHQCIGGHNQMQEYLVSHLSSCAWCSRLLTPGPKCPTKTRSAQVATSLCKFLNRRRRGKNARRELRQVRSYEKKVTGLSQLSQSQRNLSRWPIT